MDHATIACSHWNGQSKQWPPIHLHWPKPPAGRFSSRPPSRGDKSPHDGPSIARDIAWGIALAIAWR
jgi:hypothetical protein